MNQFAVTLTATIGHKKVFVQAHELHGEVRDHATRELHRLYCEELKKLIEAKASKGHPQDRLTGTVVFSFTFQDHQVLDFVGDKQVSEFILSCAQELVAELSEVMKCVNWHELVWGYLMTGVTDQPPHRILIIGPHDNEPTELFVRVTNPPRHSPLFCRAYVNTYVLSEVERLTASVKDAFCLLDVVKGHQLQKLLGIEFTEPPSETLQKLLRS